MGRQPFDGIEPMRPWAADALAAALVFLAGVALAFVLWQPRHYRPTIQDEVVYLFQARTLLGGALCARSPPLPDFFETPHILVVPRLCSKYYPGHALLLSPFVAVGAPWLFSCLALGATAALIFAGLRFTGAGRAASLAAGLLFLASDHAAENLIGYMSQSTTVLCTAAAFCAAARLRRSPSTRAAVVLGCAAGLALLSRPFTGIALGATAVIALLFPRRGTLRIWTACFAPCAVAALGLLFINWRVTGSFTTSPWTLYARQYTPGDGPGFATPDLPPPLRALPPHLDYLRQSFLASRSSYTLEALPRRAKARLLGVLFQFPPTPLVLAPAALALAFPSGALALPLAFAAFFFALQLLFHANHAWYLLEEWVAFCWLAGAGAAAVLRPIARLRHELSRLVLLFAVTLLGLLGAYAGYTDLREGYGTRAGYASRFAQIDAALEPAALVHGLVFLRYPPDWKDNLDVTLNEPDLEGADLVRALDLGERDRELRNRFPDRPAFVLDLRSLRLAPLAVR
jgi:hypothetical protein